jgi:hypothetical protein
MDSRGHFHVLDGSTPSAAAPLPKPIRHVLPCLDAMDRVTERAPRSASATALLEASGKAVSQPAPGGLRAGEGGGGFFQAHETACGARTRAVRHSLLIVVVGGGGVPERVLRQLYRALIVVRSGSPNEQRDI